MGLSKEPIYNSDTDEKLDEVIYELQQIHEVFKHELSDISHELHNIKELNQGIKSGLFHLNENQSGFLSITTSIIVGNLTSVFVVLKIMGHIDWEWWKVFLPVLIVVGLGAATGAITSIAFMSMNLREYLRSKK